MDAALRKHLNEEEEALLSWVETEHDDDEYLLESVDTVLTKIAKERAAL